MAITVDLNDRDRFERECRRAVTSTVVGPDILCRVLGDRMVYAPAEDLGLTPRLALDGFWESWVTLGLAKLVCEGSHVCDVGANCGYYCALFGSLVGLGGKLVAIEPQGRLQEPLIKTVRANGFGRISQILPYAITDTPGDGKVTIHKDELDLGTASIIHIPEEQIGGRPSSEVVEARTLDQVYPHQRLDLLKIDTEGADFAVIRSGAEVLVNNHLN